MNPCLAWALAAALFVTAKPPLRSGADSVNVEALPENLRGPYEVFASRCSKCHTLARPLNARLRGEQWRNYIKKMSRRPGSGINEQNGAQIYEFLKAYGGLVDAEDSGAESRPPPPPPSPEPPPPPPPPAPASAGKKK